MSISHLVIVRGPKQSGKTFIANAIKEQLEKQGHTVHMLDSATKPSHVRSVIGHDLLTRECDGAMETYRVEATHVIWQTSRNSIPPYLRRYADQVVSISNPGAIA